MLSNPTPCTCGRQGRDNLPLSPRSRALPLAHPALPHPQHSAGLRLLQLRRRLLRRCCRSPCQRHLHVAAALSILKRPLCVGHPRSAAGAITSLLVLLVLLLLLLLLV